MLTPAERKIAAAVDAWAALHRRELTADLAELIRIRSVSEKDDSGYPMGLGCKQATDKLAELGRKYGFAIEEEKGCYVCILSEETENQTELGILGHIDVVPEANVPLQGRQGSRGCIPDAPG